MTKPPTATEQEAQSDEKQSFEESLRRLEKIVELLDDGNIPLAESLALFQEGTKLAGICKSLLAEAEDQVKEALNEAEQSASLTPAAEEVSAYADGPEDELIF